MKTLYIDCGMGAAGDMLTAALLELLPDPDKFIEEVNALGIPGVIVKKELAAKCGINGTHVSVMVGGKEEDEQMHEHHHAHDHDHEHHHDHGNHHDHVHHHSGMHEIEHIVSKLPVSEKIKKDVLAVYNLIAEAESHAHGVDVTEIHFHEVGTMDAVADIVSVCMLMDKLSPNQVIVSPVHVGSGHVKCAHGILPVPAPATAYILKDVPIYGGEIKSELCTPTGAALLKYFADRFGQMPEMKVQSIGYGMGKKDFTAANCLRVFWGVMEDTGNTVIELKCNLDDMTPEAIGYAIDCLLEAGALDVYTVPIGMKKNRPGTMLCVMCKVSDKDKLLGLLFKHTTTLGIRETSSNRYTLNRRIDSVSTSYGEVRKKISTGYDVVREKYEYNDLSRIAKENDLSIEEVIRQIETEWNRFTDK